MYHFITFVGTKWFSTFSKHCNMIRHSHHYTFKYDLLFSFVFIIQVNYIFITFSAKRKVLLLTLNFPFLSTFPCVIILYTQFGSQQYPNIQFIVFAYTKHPISWYLSQINQTQLFIFIFKLMLWSYKTIFI